MTWHQTLQEPELMSQDTKQPQLTDLCEYYQTAPWAARGSLLTQGILPLWVSCEHIMTSQGVCPYWSQKDSQADVIKSIYTLLIYTK